MAKGLSMRKAGTILKHGEVKGHPLTMKQKRFMGFVRGGGTPTKVKGSSFKRMKRR